MDGLLWVAGMIITSDYGSFPKIPLAPVGNFLKNHQIFDDDPTLTGANLEPAPGTAVASR